MRYLLIVTAALLVAVFLAGMLNASTGLTFRERVKLAIAHMALELGDATVQLPSSAEVRKKLTDGAMKLHELRNMPKDKRGDTYEAEVRETLLEINSWDAEHKIAELREAHEAEERAAEEAERKRQEEEQRGPTAALYDLEGREARTLGEHVVSGDAYREWHESGRRTGAFNIEVEARDVRALITASTSDTPAAGVLIPTQSPIPPTPRQRKLFIRDLLASGQTGVPSFPYIRELNPATNETGATAVQEGEAKPEVTMSFVQVTATAHKIAAWVPSTQEILEDAPTLRSYIDNRLVYMVQVREEIDLISGVESGANPTIPGVTTIAGTQSQSAQQTSSVDDYLKTIGVAHGKVENVDGEANGIAMNPIDYWAAMTTRWGTDGNFDSSSPFNGPPGTLWGNMVVRTRALASSQSIVADWQRGGQVFDRTGITVRTSDSHDDYFVKNKLAILAEKRVAVAWYRPDFFVIVDLTT